MTDNHHDDNHHDERRRVLAALRSTRVRLASLHRKEAAIYAERLALYKTGRAVKLSQREMGDAAGISEPAIIQALRKDRLEREAQASGGVELGPARLDSLT